MFAITVQNASGDVTETKQFTDGSFVLGRASECDITLESTNVSRKHARIFVQHGRCYVEDLGSANGVVVDGQRVVGQRDLGTASQVQIGDYFVFVETRSARDHLSPIAQTLFISDDTSHNKLVRINDPFAGEEFSLSEVSNTIGRTDENFILLSDASISREHAQIMRNGEFYTLVDMGSSNGSRVNGKPVRGSADLKIGDRIHFGNLEFVFVRGETKIDPSEYASAPGGQFVMTIGAGILGLLILAATLFLVVGFLRTGGEEPIKTGVSSDRTAELIERAKKKIERRNFDSAVNILSDVVKYDPQNTEAKAMLETAKVEQAGADTLTSADRMIEVGSFDDAIELLNQVPENTQAHERAREQIGRVNKMHAHKLKSDADRLAKKDGREDLRKARETYSKALKILPDDPEIKKALKRLETKMRKKKIKLDKLDL